MQNELVAPHKVDHSTEHYASGGAVALVLHRDVEQAGNEYRLTRKGTYAVPLSVVSLTYSATIGEDSELECELKFICRLDEYTADGDKEVRVYGLQGKQVAINDFLMCLGQYRLHVARSRFPQANAAQVDYYHQVMDQLDEELRADDCLDARDDVHAVATVSL